MTYASLELSLQQRGAQAYAVELCFQLDVDSAPVHLCVDEPPVSFDSAVLRQTQLDPTVYGTSLTQMLFADPRLRQLFIAVRAQAVNAQLPLRLRLRLDSDDATLHSICWETLRDPERDDVLCLSEQLLLARYLDSADMTPLNLRPRAALTALVVIANPTGLEQYPQLVPVDVSSEVRRAHAALASIPTVVIARELNGQPASLDTICAALREGPDIVYLVAHGTIQDERAVVWLEDANGQVCRTAGEEVVNAITRLADRPVLVVLASCQSAGTSHDTGALAALGPRLARAGIAAVVAMQGNVTMITIADFMPMFFGELQRDGQIDRAFTVARGSVMDRPDWWVPVLFLRVPNGRLWCQALPDQAQPKPAPAALLAA